MTERCWHGKFSETRCAAPGRYGHGGDRSGPTDSALRSVAPFMRAARWCFVHRHPSDVLVEPDGQQEGSEGTPILSREGPSF